MRPAANPSATSGPDEAGRRNKGNRMRSNKLKIAIGVILAVVMALPVVG